MQSGNSRQKRATAMRRSNWIRNAIGVIIIIPLFAILAGCGGGTTGVSGIGGGDGGGGGAASLSAIFSWAPVTTNVDGSPLTDLGGYKVYYGTESGVFPNSIDVGNNISCTIDGLASGNTYYLAVTSYDTAGNESNFSPIVSLLM